MIVPVLRIEKIDRDWYLYEVRAQGVHVVGHGTREYVTQQVDAALGKAQAER